MTRPAPTTAGASPPADAAEVLTRDEIRLIAEIGFLACGARNGKAGRIIFEALRTLEPGRAHPYLGLAMAHMCVERPEEAVRILREEGLPAHPDDEDMQLFLALALRAARQTAESERVLRALLACAGPASPTRRFAASMLREAHEGADALHAGGAAVVGAKVRGDDELRVAGGPAMDAANTVGAVGATHVAGDTPRTEPARGRQPPEFI